MTEQVAGGETPRPIRRPRTDEQILGALAGHTESGLQVTLGGESRYLKPLSIKAERSWKATVGPMISAAAMAAGEIGELDDAAGLAALLGPNVDEVLDLVLSFDALGTGTLNREWLEEHASGMEIRSTLEVLLDSVYPPMPGAPVKPGRMMLGMLLAGAAARSASGASTSGSSPGTRGSTAPRTSKRR